MSKKTKSKKEKQPKTYRAKELEAIIKVLKKEYSNVASGEILTQIVRVEIP